MFDDFTLQAENLGKTLAIIKDVVEKIQVDQKTLTSAQFQTSQTSQEAAKLTAEANKIKSEYEVKLANFEIALDSLKKEEKRIDEIRRKALDERKLADTVIVQAATAEARLVKINEREADLMVRERKVLDEQQVIDSEKIKDRERKELLDIREKRISKEEARLVRINAV